MAGRPKKIKIEKEKITSTSGKTTIILPKSKALAESLSVKPEDIEILIENSEGEGEITINKANEGLFMKPSDDGLPQEEPVLLNSNPGNIDTPKIEVDKIIKKYLELCQTESDINELLPYIYEIALQCETCVEFGVRRPTSTYAFLAAKSKRLISYDIGRYDEVDEVETLCKEANINFKFILANVLEIEIEETDCLLIDTYHTFSQLTRELLLHGNKIKKYIMMHDTYTFRFVGQPWTPGVADHMNCGRGLWPAIENFLRDNPHWSIFAEHTNNNGLTILKRND